MAAKPKVKFISVDYLKENTTIQKNVDDDILVPFIYKSQHTHLQQALGTNFYDHLASGVTNNSLTSDEEDLLRNYVQPMVSEWTLYEVMPHINYKLTNKAVSQNSSEFGQPSGLDEVKYLHSSIRDLAEFYTARLNQYLCDYKTLFPIYKTQEDKENLKKSSRSYFSGVFIPKSGAGTYGIRTYNDPSDDCC